MYLRLYQILFFIVIQFTYMAVNAQDCGFTVKGRVYDEVSNQPLSFVNVIVQENSKGTMTDDEGNFELNGLCEGEYHLQISHIGCMSHKIHIHIPLDTSLNIALTHTETSLGTIVVEDEKNKADAIPNISINRQKVEDNANKNLASLLENEAGVHLLKNGSGVAKPVVQGLYGNRLIILNNGIVQSGQQWGNDHSPEIDPSAADKIVVLKGVNAIEYSGGNLGSVLLVEPQRIPEEPHLHGQLSYIYESNGHGHNINTRLGKYNPKLAWRLNGTLKKYGDRKAANYFLNNTGVEEANLSLQLEKKWNDKLSMDFYASTFNTRIGILRGAHIGNLTDLETALSQDVPFFTEPDFSYDIDAPRQVVSHHLSKLRTNYLISDNQQLDWVTAVQFNNRKEYDVRRGGRSDIPATGLFQFTWNNDIKYQKFFDHNWKITLGTQNIFTNNSNDPETGILPLIPDYLSWKSGFFTTLSKENEHLHYKMGLRYDYEYQNVATISNGIPREIIRYNNHFHNVTGVLSVKYDISATQFLSFNTGYAMRNPGINELYGSGLHQGVGAIEEGDINLETEKALKNVLAYKWFPNNNFSLNAMLYHQLFDNYIFLNPQDETRLTIRGAFPVFKYEQTGVNIYGLDIASQFTIDNSWQAVVKYSFIRGVQRGSNLPLIAIPSNMLFTSLDYQFKQVFRLSPNIRLEELAFQLSNRWVMKQSQILPEQDFVAPPPAYTLLGLKVSTNVYLPHYKFRVFIKADNVLNASYRDYLNRQRYFADDLGISITLGVNMKF